MLLHIILPLTNSATPQDRLFGYFCEFGALAILYSPSTRSPWTLLTLSLSLSFPSPSQHVLDPQSTSVLISAVAPSCTFSSAFRCIISECGGVTLSNSGSEKWKYLIETGYVESLYKQYGEQSGGILTIRRHVSKNNGVNHCLETSIHLHWLQEVGIR